MRTATDEYRRVLEADRGAIVSTDSLRPDDIGAGVSRELGAMGLSTEPEAQALEAALGPCFGDGRRMRVLDVSEDVLGALEGALEDAIGLVEEALPEGWYYGPAEGDGAYFGIWHADEDESEEI